ncbi:helix-turn-helix transcriptional regulator (plasmid) [Alicyclobacillus sp. ALC3]|nr:helix-turn-helix transcriptional regulator [Alicyclobacillus sp. ALC3]
MLINGVSVVATQLQKDCCDQLSVHSDAVADCMPTQLSESAVQSLVDSFKALADPTRIRMLHNLTRRELCVCDLAEVLGMTQSAVSHQLRYLRTLRIVKSRRDGNTVYYTCDDAHIVGLLQMGIDHISHVERDEERVYE